MPPRKGVSPVNMRASPPYGDLSAAPAEADPALADCPLVSVSEITRTGGCPLFRQITNPHLTVLLRARSLHTLF